MIEKILQFSKGNFYQEKTRQIAEVVKQYADARQGVSAPEEVQKAQAHAEEVLTGFMLENGYASEPYISLDKEFFTEEGSLDEKRLEKFQKDMIRHYSKEQIRWTFAGTTSCYSPVTLKALKKQNISYPEMLPLEIKREYQDKEKEKDYTTRTPGKFYAYMYPDGSVSSEMIQEKKTVKLDSLQDNSGFDWGSGYSPDNVVKKRGWHAGFNGNEVWEKMDMDENAGFMAARDYDPVALFTGSEANGKLGILSFLDASLLFDIDSLLMEGEQENFYTLSGELYGAREMDKERSLDQLKKNLKRNKVSRLSAIVLRKATKEAVMFYKKVLGDFILPGTRFYSRTDEELGTYLQAIKEEIEGKEISRNILTGFQTVSRKVKTADELYRNLAPSSETAVYEVPLHIFDSKDDMLSFLTLPEISSTLEEEAALYLKQVEIPDAEKTAYSNAVQNILHNYRAVFAYTSLPQVEILKTAKQVIVEKSKGGKIGQELITGEKSFYDLVLDSSRVKKKTDIPSFTAVFKKEKDYYNLFNEEEFTQWSDRTLKSRFPGEVIEQLKAAFLSGQWVENRAVRYSRAVQNMLDEYPAIASATGMKPAEIVAAVKAVLAGTPGTVSYKKKRIFFEKTLENLVEEAAFDNPHRVPVSKQDLYNQHQPKLVWKPFDTSPDLFDKEELKLVLASPFLTESGLNQDEGQDIARFMEQTVLPESGHIAFSESILNLVRGYKYKLKPAGISLVSALKGLKSLVTGSHSELTAEQLNLIRYVSRQAFYSSQPVETIQDTAAFFDAVNSSPDTFLHIPLIAESGMEAGEAEKLQQYLKNFEQKVQNQIPADIIRIAANYRNVIKPAGISAVEALQALEAADKGKKIAPNLIPVVKKLKEKTASPAVAPVLSSGSQVEQLLTDSLDKFVVSPLVAGNGLTPEDGAEIYQYVQKVRLPALQKPLFTGAVSALLRDFKTITAPAGIKALAAVKNLAGAFRGNWDKVPVPLQSYFKKIMAPGSTIEPTTESHAPDLSDVNLLKAEDFRNFTASSLFRSSGLTGEQLENLVAAHRQAYGGKEKRHYRPVPVLYREAESQAVPLDIPLPMSSGQADLVNNLGWVQRETGQELPVVHFTEKGTRTYSPLMRRQIAALQNASLKNSLKNRTDSFPGNQGKRLSLSRLNKEDLKTGRKNLEFPLVKDTTPGQQPDAFPPLDMKKVQIDIPGQHIARHEEKAGDNNLPLSFPSFYKKIAGIQSGANQTQGWQPVTFDSPGQSVKKLQKTDQNIGHPEEERLKRIERHYIEDKQMLARSKSHSPLTGTTESSEKGKDEGNVIKKTTGDIISEMKNDMGIMDL